MWTTPLRAGVFTLAATVGLALTATVASASSTDLPAPTGTAPVSATGLGDAKLVNVRTGRHAAYDRTVFDFTGGTPGYRVEYGTLVSGGTGNPIPLAGAAALVVVFTPAFAHDINTGAVTYDITRNPCRWAVLTNAVAVPFPYTCQDSSHSAGSPKWTVRGPDMTAGTFRPEKLTVSVEVVVRYPTNTKDGSAVARSNTSRSYPGCRPERTPFTIVF